MRLAFIGYGEVGQTFARQFLARGDVAVLAYDILFDAGALTERARQAGVIAARNAAEAARDADVVISAVTADAVLNVARDAESYLKPRQFFSSISTPLRRIPRRVRRKSSTKPVRITSKAPSWQRYSNRASPFRSSPAVPPQPNSPHA